MTKPGLVFSACRVQVVQTPKALKIIKFTFAVIIENVKLLWFWIIKIIKFQFKTKSV